MRFPPEIVVVLAPVLVGLAHYVNALGHKERVEAEKVEAIMAILDREQVH